MSRNRLNTVYRAAGLALLWGVAMVSPLAAERGASPLRVEPPVLELDRVPQHHLAQVQVVLVNDGDTDITVQDVGKTCPDCLSFSLHDRVLPPGAATILEIVYDPAGYSGDIEEHVVIETDHPDVGNLALPLRGQVVEPYTLGGLPVFLEARGGSAVQRVRVSPEFEMQGTLTGLISPHEACDVRVEPDPADRLSYLVEITLKEGAPAGLTQTELELTSSHAGDPVCRIPVAAFVPPPFHVYPAGLKIGPLQREQLRILFTRQTLSPPARIIDVELPDELARYEFIPHGVAESRLNLYFYQMGDRDGHIGDVVLKTDHPEVGDIRIPVSVSEDYRQALKPSRLLTGARKKGCCGGK